MNTETTTRRTPGRKPTADASTDLAGLVEPRSLNIMDGLAVGGLDDVMADGIPTYEMDQPWNEKGPLERNTPPARQGFVQRWVRIEDVSGNPDRKNLQRAFDEKWRPRKLDDIPTDGTYSVLADATFGNMIAYGGMILCERPVEWEEYFAGKLQARTDRLTAETRRNITGGITPRDERYAGITGGSKVRTSTGAQQRSAESIMDD